jgi:hypothetical protein
MTLAMTPAGTVFHYGKTNDVFLIWGFVLQNKTSVACALQHLRHLACFHLIKHEGIYLCQVFDGVINQEHAKIFMFVKDIRADKPTNPGRTILPPPIILLRTLMER